MDLFIQDGVRLTLTRWLAAAFQEKKSRHTTCKRHLRARQQTMGLPQGSPLSLVLYNVYTKGQVDLNSNGLNRVFTLAHSGLIHKTVTQTHTAATNVQQQLETVSEWCQQTQSEISPSKTQDQSVGQAMPVVSLNGEVMMMMMMMMMMTTTTTMMMMRTKVVVVVETAAEMAAMTLEAVLK